MDDGRFLCRLVQVQDGNRKEKNIFCYGYCKSTSTEEQQGKEEEEDFLKAFY